MLNFYVHLDQLLNKIVDHKILFVCIDEYMIKTFDPFGSSYMGQANELFKMEQKNGSL
jgi:hypothetical protein